MRVFRRVITYLLLLSILFPIGKVFAQDYHFQVETQLVDVYINEDGSASIEYYFVFVNDSNAAEIDYIDIGMPNPKYDLNSISATIDGKPINNIESSPYVDFGFAVALGSDAIPPGERGEVYVYVGEVREVLFVASQKEEEPYASFQFSPVWFSSDFAYGNSDMVVTLHMPPGLADDEPRYITPKKWPGANEPISGYDEEGRIVYQWSTNEANSYTQYTFGATLPARFVPESAVSEDVVVTFDSSRWTGILIPLLCCGGFVGLFVLILVVAIKSSKKRKLKYMPPKIAVEGMGIKRGLTPVVAGILMEQPMDKILTMILFSTMKKEASEIVTRDPLEVKVNDPIPEDFRTYEKSFLEAFKLKDKRARTRALQNVMVELVKSVSEKMKGFSRKETIAFYKDIMEKAWKQVEQADTPEVKGERYQDNMEWTMLDRDYDERTRRTFGTGPTYMPWWWWRTVPRTARTSTFGRSVSTGKTVSAGKPSGGSKTTTVRIPRLAGSNAAASVATTVQAFSAGVVGNLTNFTNRITNKTNPVPTPSSSGRSFRPTSGGGRPSCVCACACACAGCACACAGGGR